MSKSILSSLIVVCCLSVAVQAAIIDTNPAPFRNAPGSTLQSWGFDTGANPSGPDVDLNPNGIAEFSVAGNLLDGTFHYDEYDGQTGVWGIEDYDIVIDVPNFINENPTKEIWIQLTYTASYRPNLFVLPEGDVGQAVFMTFLGETQVDAGPYFHATYSATIEPNPDWEQILVKPADCTSYIDDITVETICIPEPATMCLLGLGGLALLRRKRR